MAYHNNNHFEIIYSKHVNINNVHIVKKIKDIPINKNIKNKDIKLKGSSFKNNYVEINNKTSNLLYDEISTFLLSILEHEKEIKLLEIQNPNWHYNQILSKFDLNYPKRLKGKDSSLMEKRKNFRKCISSYKIIDYVY